MIDKVKITNKPICILDSNPVPMNTIQINTMLVAERAVIKVIPGSNVTHLIR